jgi:GT2 family glycosyltransferase
MSKKLAIILVNWNSYALTDDTLQSLYKTSYKEYDIICVDNASTDDSLNQLRKNHSDIILLTCDQNTGFTGGNNKGMQYALEHGYAYTLLLNNDVAVESDFLEPLVQALDANENLGAVQPLIYFHHDRTLIWNAGSCYNKWLGVTKAIGYNKKDKDQKERYQKERYRTDQNQNQGDTKDIQPIQNIAWITGCAFMVKTDVLKKVGLLYEPFFIYYEDVDLSFRIKNAGYDLGYTPASVIYHIAGMSHKSTKKTAEGYISPKVHYLNARNHIWLLKKYTNLLHAPTVILYQSIYYLSVTGYFIIRGRWQKIKALYKGIGEGLRFGIQS